jgi:hypothetical protein
MAMSKNDASQDRSARATARARAREGVDANESAKSLGLVSTIAFGAGAAMMIGGALLVLAAPKASAKEGRAVRIAPTASAGGGGLFVSGTF